MKLKAIEKICKAAKTVILWPTEDGRVFAGDGGAFYLLPDALSKISARDMLDVFDVPVDRLVRRDGRNRRRIQKTSVSGARI